MNIPLCVWIKFQQITNYSINNYLAINSSVSKKYILKIRGNSALKKNSEQFNIFSQRAYKINLKQT